MTPLNAVADRISLTEGVSRDSASGMLDALQRMAPLVRERRGSFDQLRRLPDDVFETLADAGLFRLWLPRAIGGPELSPFEFMSIVEAASALDGSIGWLVGNGGGMSRVGGYVGKAVARDWFSDRHAFVAAATGAVGTATRVAGGYRVAGRWPFGSGAHHASLFMVLAAEAPEAPRLCCHVGRNDVTILDNWHVSGLRGTGSCDFELRDVFVPEAHVHPFLDLTPTDPGMVYRMPPVSVFAWTISAVPLGIAGGAIAAFIELARHKGLGGTGLLRDREPVQAAVGRADAMLRAARAFLVDAMTELMAGTDAGGERLLQARAAFRTAATHAAESAASIVDMLAASAGSVSIFETCPLERAARDVRAAARHVALSSNNYVVRGRVALGLDPGTARF
ncbi:MAG: acyl-CoA dehydrogenase family protein [Rhodospirillales bacterium]|nr:acyl-CoA dehydrogenase family protein [Rhodospirillales bacterium]